MKSEYDNYQGIKDIMDDAFEHFDRWDKSVKELQAMYAGQMYKAIPEQSHYYKKATQEIQRHQRLFSIVLKQWWKDSGHYGTY